MLVRVPPRIAAKSASLWDMPPYSAPISAMVTGAAIASAPSISAPNSDIEWISRSGISSDFPDLIDSFAGAVHDRPEDQAQQHRLVGGADAGRRHQHEAGLALAAIEPAAHRLHSVEDRRGGYALFLR